MDIALTTQNPSGRRLATRTRYCSELFLLDAVWHAVLLTLIMQPVQAVEVLDDTPWETLLPATTNITNSHMACTETLVLSLKCFSALLSLPSIKMPQHIQFLGELLSTYSAASCKDAAGHVVPLKINFSQPAWHATLEAPKLTDLVQLLKKTFDFMASLLRGPKGVLDHDVLVVRVLRELCSVPDTVLHAAGVSDVGILEHFPTQQRRVCCRLLLLPVSSGDSTRGREQPLNTTNQSLQFINTSQRLKGQHLCLY